MHSCLAKAAGPAAFDLLDDGVLLLNPDGMVRYVNQSWLDRLGLCACDLTGKHISLLCSQTFSGLIDNQLAKVVQKGKSTFKSVHVDQRGHEVYVDVSAKLVDVNGTQMILCRLRDMSPQRQHAHMQELM